MINKENVDRTLQQDILVIVITVFNITVNKRCLLTWWMGVDKWYYEKEVFVAD